MAQRKLDRLVQKVDRLADELDTADDDQLMALWRLKQAANHARRVAYRPNDATQYTPIQHHFASLSPTGTTNSFDDSAGPSEAQPPRPTAQDLNERDIRRVISFFEARGGPPG